VTVLPAVDDVDTAGHFAAAADGRLAVRRCATCDAVLHLPVAYCRHCGNVGDRWVDVAPVGRIYSYTVVTHQVHPDFPVPYTVLLIELEELPEVRLIGHLEGRPEVYVGQPVAAEFKRLSATAGVPVWRLRDERT